MAERQTRKPGPQRRAEMKLWILPAFGKTPLTEGRQRVILHLQFSLRVWFQQGAAGSRLHFTVPEGNNNEGWVRVLGFVAVICSSETYTASWSQAEPCIISYLQEVNFMSVKLDVTNSATIKYRLCQKSLTWNLCCHDGLDHFPQPESDH